MKNTPALTDADINEIDLLLAAVPAPFETVDAVILDGYLAGVLVQPVELAPEQWLPPIFGTEGMPEGGIEGWTQEQHDKLIGLITRRKDEILRGILEDGWFDPIIPLIEDDDGKVLEGKDAMEGIGYWAAGFEWALANFPQLEDAALPGVPDLLDSIWRHLPEQDETQQAMTKALD
ncbi:MAG: YecA family protein, partial [Aquabacterium sp.]|uniref:YecA/YgfB family protein n=1 Tax=Aquabacterium sp. TaxID=1872578 RepID=UPI0011F48330